jgi:hypothetical protein
MVQNIKLITRKCKTILCVSLFLFLVCRSYGEEYETAIGVRFGGVTQGISVKHFLNTNSALEGILSFGHHSFLVTGLYEKQLPVNGAPGLYWFYGIGVHIGFYNGGDYFYYTKHGQRYYYDDRSSSAVLGIDLILGMEYKFQNAPITIGLDIKPAFDFVEAFPGYWDGALTARFAF